MLSSRSLAKKWHRSRAAARNALSALIALPLLSISVVLVGPEHSTATERSESLVSIRVSPLTSNPLYLRRV
jgi:hypothetical protein